jgi:pimeloyl-ACP methyl ester carboxylesterase
VPDVRSNGVVLRYETAGDPADPVLLLVMGLGAQLIDWPPDFVELLAGQGFRVVLFDNRDSGLSTVLDHLGTPGPRGAPYLLADLAADAAGLLRALGVPRAHVVGVSMGGMIAQQLTVDHPDLVASLCSIMSTTGDPAVGRPTAEAAALLTGPPAASREEAVAAGVAGFRVTGSPAYPVDEADLRMRAAARYDRGFHPSGTRRQFAAILASPDRTAALRHVRVPTVVIHGTADPLITPSGGRATAAAVPGAHLLEIPGMGHDLPVEVWPDIIDAITANACRESGQPAWHA